MRTKLIVVCYSLMFASIPGCVLAQQLATRTFPISVDAFVHDPNGNPVGAATVVLSATYYGGRAISGKTVRAETDKSGHATVSIDAESEYRVSAEKSGYYRTNGPSRGLDTEIGIKQFAVGMQATDIELRPISNPIVGIIRGVSGLRVPELGKPIGFDFEVGDWVAPHGKGRVPDFIAELDGYDNGPTDNSVTLDLKFLHPGDGIQALNVMPSSSVGSAFKFPYEAPMDGYGDGRTWKKSRNGKTIILSVDLSGATNYLFRIRTEFDDSGRIKRALYGVIASEFDFGKKNDTDYGISFSYWLNPEWTRSLESDPTKTATSVRP